tara:strand:+ start:415 stop:537 length:123 start_codon:yes stop_codon:yes gene_type:complete
LDLLNRYVPNPRKIKTGIQADKNGAITPIMPIELNTKQVK